MKNKKILALTLGLASSLPIYSYAGIPILDAVAGQGVAVVALADDALDGVKGTRLIANMPMPSVTVGINNHFVRYKNFGSRADFRSFSYVGNLHNKSDNRQRAEEGVTVPQRIAGDEWFADFSGRNLGLRQFGQEKMEYHYQLLDKNTGAPRETAFHSTRWNRPLTTFRW